MRHLACFIFGHVFSDHFIERYGDIYAAWHKGICHRCGRKIQEGS